MSKEEFQKLHDEMRALRTAGNHDEFAKKFAAKGAIFIGPLHDPVDADGAVKLAKNEKMAALLKAEFDVKLDEVTQVGETVVTRCTINAKLPTGEKSGWTLTVWVKEGGAWKIRYTCATFKSQIPGQ
uniref:DUF4440 domain-containing protein n=1 Tax=Caenorhabditis japonica TaxID=281687 RepID=A0A8R1I3D2_CAEJA